MARRGALRAASSIVAVAVTSCTFGGLADYEIASCNPHHQTQAEDECDHLNHGDKTTCTPLQCDATQRCVAKPRDDDRDGDPSAACGGSDCDDSDPTNFGGTHAKERCDGRDNNCDKVRDENLPYGGGTAKALNNVGGNGASTYASILGTSGASLVGAYVAASPGGTCIAAVALGTNSGSLAAAGDCAFLGDALNLVPSQPAARLLAINGPRGAAAVFSATGTCGPTGALGYRWAAQNSATGALDMPCDVAMKLGGGAALPMVDQVPSGPALVLWYGVALTARDDPFTDCVAMTAPAKLYAIALPDPTAPAATFPATPTPIVDGGVAMRPPATLAVPGLDGAILVAAPTASDVGVWLVDGTAKATAIVPAIPSFAGARAVAMSAGKADGSKVPIAIVAEIGCQPAAVKIVFGTFDTASKQASFTAMAAPMNQVTAAMGAFSVSPAVTFLSHVPFQVTGERNEWMVTWLVDGPQLMGRRYAPDGTPLSDKFALADHVAGGVPGADGEIYAVGDDRATFLDVPVVCPP